MDDDQQFCLRWNNHQSTLISVFDTLLESETLVDCTLFAEGKFLKAHKVVLSACSPYFATLLQEQYDKHPIFILKDVKFPELRAMMDYMYRGEVNISQDQLAALLKAAESLQIKGLSDNRSGGGIAPKHEQQQQQQHHRGSSLNVPISAAAKMSAGYTLEQTKRARIGPSAMDVQEMTASREGSSSPSRRRRKVRRRSIENAMADVHDNSNSSQMQAANQTSSILQQTNANLAGVGAITAAASVLASQIPVTAGLSTAAAASVATSGTMAAAITQGTNQQQQQQQQQQQLTTSVTKKTESVKGTSDAMNTDNVQAAGAVVADMSEDLEATGKLDKQNHKQKLASAAALGKDTTSDLVIEPKSEYDDEGNDETVEDLTLDDEDMGMDDLDHNAGTSQGGEGSSQGYAPWQHDRSQDELLLATQEAQQQRDPQDIKFDMKYGFEESMMMGADMTMQRFPCAVCNKSYLRKRHLQRHMRDECIGIPPRFSCELCPSRFRRKYHMVRHLTAKHGIPPAIAQQTSGGNARASIGTGGMTGINISNDLTLNGNMNGCGGGGFGAGAVDCKNGIVGAVDCKNGIAGIYGTLSGADGGGSVGSGCSPNGYDSPLPENLSIRKEKDFKYDMENNMPRSPLNIGVGHVGTGSDGVSPIMPIPTYSLTGAITAMSAAAAMIEDNAKQAATNEEAVGGAAGGINIKNEPLTPSKHASMLEEDWKMKLSLQLISNSLLKERLMNTMPFSYNNNK